MEAVLGEFLRLMFQPPVLVLFCLAVAGLSVMLRDRSDYRDRVNMEWRVRESFYRQVMEPNEELIARARRHFYKRHGMKDHT